MILASILLAFFLDGWRDDHQLDLEMRQEIESVRSEIQRNQDLVRAELVTLDRILAANDALLAVLDEAQGRGSVSVADTLVFLARSWHTTFSPSLGAVDALIGSGRLAQIDSPDLREGLAGLREAIDDALEDELMARGIGINQLDPLLRGMYRFENLARDFFDDPVEGLTTQERLGNVAVPSHGAVAFPARLDVRNVLMSRRAWCSSARREFSELQDRLDDLSTMLSEELDQRAGRFAP